MKYGKIDNTLNFATINYYKRELGNSYFYYFVNKIIPSRTNYMIYVF